MTPTLLTGRTTAKAWLVSWYQGLPVAGSVKLRSSSMKIASAWRSRSANSFFTSPRIRTPQPGPGGGGGGGGQGGGGKELCYFFLRWRGEGHAEAGAGEWVAVDHLGRQAQGQAQLAHFVLEQVAQWFQQFQAQLLGQATDVVVALDGDRLFALGAARFDHVGIDGALREESGAPVLGLVGFELGGLGL